MGVVGLEGLLWVVLPLRSQAHEWCSWIPKVIVTYGVGAKMAVSMPEFDAFARRLRIHCQWDYSCLRVGEGDAARESGCQNGNDERTMM